MLLRTGAVIMVFSLHNREIAGQTRSSRINEVQIPPIIRPQQAFAGGETIELAPVETGDGKSVACK